MRICSWICKLLEVLETACACTAYAGILGGCRVCRLDIRHPIPRPPCCRPHWSVCLSMCMQGMGRAQVECISGCSCEPSVLDGWWERHASLQVMHTIMVSECEYCGAVGVVAMLAVAACIRQHPQAVQVTAVCFSPASCR